MTSGRPDIAIPLGVAAFGVVIALAYWGMLPVHAAVAFGMVLVLLAYVMLVRETLRSVLWRVLLALLPVLAMAVLVIIYLVLPNQTLQALELQAAAFAGTVIASGWLVTFVASEYKRADERETTRIDTLNALEIEIFSITEKLDKSAIRASAGKVQKKIRSGGNSEERKYHPFVATESPPTVFEALSDRIVVFEPRTLQVVLRFYAAYSDLRAMAEDHRALEFCALSAARRANAHEELTNHRENTFYWGVRALVRINAALERGSYSPKAEHNTDLEARGIREQSRQER